MFADAKRKLEWANKRIHELDDRLNKFSQAKFYRTGEKLKVNGAEFEVMKAELALPDDIDLRVSEALLHLRAPLDYVWHDILRARDPNAWVRFPVAESREKVEAALRMGKMQVTSPAVCKCVLDVIQPYARGSGDVLWQLHDGHNSDKHFKVTPIITDAAVTVTFGGNIEYTVISPKPGIAQALQAPGSPNMEGNAGPAVVVRFGKGQMFEGRPIVPTLHVLSTSVYAAIGLIEMAYSRDPTPLTRDHGGDALSAHDETVA